MIRLARPQAKQPVLHHTEANANAKKTSWIWAHGEEVAIDGAPYWQCSHCSSEPKRYKVSAGTHSPAIHLKEKHGVAEDISRKAKRLAVQKSNVEQAAEAAQRMQKRQVVGVPETPGKAPIHGMQTHTNNSW
jgi:hypothetical protein